MVNIRSHQYSIIRGHTEESNEPYPDRYTQVDGMHLEEVAHVFTRNAEIHKPRLPIEPQENKTASESYEYTRKMNQRGRHRTKLEIEYQQDNEQSQRNNNHQPVRSTLLLFIITGKLIRNTFGEKQFTAFYFSLEQITRLLHHIHFGTA